MKSVCHALLACLACMILFISPCRAAETELSLGLGFSADVMPYKDYSTQWTPRPIISFEHEYAYIRGFDAGVKILNMQHLEFSAFLQYDDVGFDSADSTDWRLRRLDDRYSSILGGLGVNVITPYGVLQATGAVDLLGQSDGLKGNFAYLASVELGPLEIMPAVGLNWYSDKYNNYYYGVGRKESQKSGLKRYKAGSGINPYVELTMELSLDDEEKWSVIGQFDMEFQHKNVKDSPMVDRDYSYGFTTGVMYNF